MRAFPTFRRTVRFLLPVAVLLTACGKKDDKPAPAQPDQGKVLFINAASHIAPITLKFVVNNSEKASLSYGTGSTYQAVQTGSQAVQVKAGSQDALAQSITVDKDKNYTFVATPAATSSSVGGLLFPDDLTAPAATKARIRVINLGQSVAVPIRLSQITTTAGGPVVVDIVTNVDANKASAFVEFTPDKYALSILESTDSRGKTIAEVGDGSGSGTGMKTYEAGKIYTVLVSGTQGSLNGDQKLKAFVLQNN